MKLLSLFSGCGGMDIGFEGGFSCLKRSINVQLHPNWIESESGDWVTLRHTGFDTVFANDIRPDAKRIHLRIAFIMLTALLILLSAQNQEKKYFLTILML